MQDYFHAKALKHLESIAVRVHAAHHSRAMLLRNYSVGHLNYILEHMRYL